MKIHAVLRSHRQSTQKVPDDFGVFGKVFKVGPVIENKLMYKIPEVQDEAETTQ